LKPEAGGAYAAAFTRASQKTHTEALPDLSADPDMSLEYQEDDNSAGGSRIKHWGVCTRAQAARVERAASIRSRPLCCPPGQA
jgi:hypothetical protein